MLFPTTPQFVSYPQKCGLVWYIGGLKGSIFLKTLLVIEASIWVALKILDFFQ
jgi:hypothetical protein